MGSCGDCNLSQKLRPGLDNPLQQEFRRQQKVLNKITSGLGATFSICTAYPEARQLSRAAQRSYAPQSGRSFANECSINCMPPFSCSGSEEPRCKKIATGIICCSDVGIFCEWFPFFVIRLNLD